MDKGFTVIELIIVLALVSIIAGLGLVMSLDAYRGAIFHSELQTLDGMLRQARAAAIDNQDDFSHSVYITSHSIRLDQNEPVAISAAISSNHNEILFNPWSGNLGWEMTINLVSGRRNAAITINMQGSIND